MGKFVEKNGAVISVATFVASAAAMVGSYVWSIFRSDKQQIKYYEKQADVQDAQLDYYRSITRK